MATARKPKQKPKVKSKISRSDVLAPVPTKINRRQAISTVGKVAIAAGAVIVIGGVAYYVSSSSNNTPTSTSTPMTSSTTSVASSTSTTSQVASTSAASSFPSVITIGAPFPLSGAEASIGNDSKTMVNLYVNYINNNGGIKSMNGAKLNVVFVDNQGDPNVGVTETEVLINQNKVSALQNGFLSGVVLTESQVSENAGVPMVTGSSSNPSLTQRGYSHFFRCWMADNVLAAQQVAFLQTMMAANPSVTVKNVAILNDNTLFGTGVGSYVEQAIGALAGSPFNIVANITYPANPADMTSEVEQLASANADVLFTGISSTGDAILSQETFKKYNVDFKATFSASGHINPPYLAIGTDAYYPICRVPWSTDLLVTKPWEQQWATMFQQASGGTQFYTYPADSWTCLNVIRNALETAASADPEKITAALKATNLGPDDCMEGYSGVKFDATGQNTLAVPLHVQLMPDQLWHVVSPANIASYQYVFPQPTWKQRAAGQWPPMVTVNGYTETNTEVLTTTSSSHS